MNSETLNIILGIALVIAAAVIMIQSNEIERSDEITADALAQAQICNGENLVYSEAIKRAGESTRQHICGIISAVKRRPEFQEHAIAFRGPLRELDC